MPGIKLLYQASDGASTYKCAQRLEKDKETAVKLKKNFMISVTPPGCGKGEHDREGGLTASDYKRNCAKTIGTDCRDLSKVRDYNEENRTIIGKHDPNVKKRVFRNTTYSEVETCRKRKSNILTLFCDEKGFITRSHFCFFITADPSEHGVWYRKYTCTSCDLCRSGEWKFIKQCENTLCGKWRFIQFEYEDEHTNPKRKFDGTLLPPKKRSKNNCKCGGTINRNNFSQHVKTKKPRRWLCCQKL